MIVAVSEVGKRSHKKHTYYYCILYTSQCMYDIDIVTYLGIVSDYLLLLFVVSDYLETTWSLHGIIVRIIIIIIN